MNPATTLTFMRLGRVAAWDAVFFVISQYVGGFAGVLVARLVAPNVLAHPSVHFVVTAPGPRGALLGALGELVISFVLMLTVLTLNANPRWSRATGLVAGILVASFIAIEAPYSGMSMNPARTAASAVVAKDWTAWWIYVFAPLLGMLGAAEVHLRTRGAGAGCAKLNHTGDVRCIFCDPDGSTSEGTWAASSMPR
jgi:aquaporin Z